MNKRLRHFNRERLKEEAALGIYALMEDNMSRADLAKAIGKSRSFVTKILGGSHNFTLETLADIYAALDRSVHLTLGSDLREVRLPVDEVATVDAVSSATINFPFAICPMTVPGYIMRINFRSARDERGIAPNRDFVIKMAESS